MAGRKDSVKMGGYVYKAGDKVMRIRNNYDKEVFSGNIEFIDGMSLGEGR